MIPTMRKVGIGEAMSGFGMREISMFSLRSTFRPRNHFNATYPLSRVVSTQMQRNPK